MAIELLAPAGNYEKLETAFNYGADAAYMGMTRFSLRANAGNFDTSEIEKVKALKAKTGKKLYCT
ncbi:MAG: U32 family peptidase, partial [Spirochaetales bacterium]|nr:U32 family peptidase [Candidatus Physcosoma equi]